MQRCCGAWGSGMLGMGQGLALYPFCSVASSGQTENLVNPSLLGWLSAALAALELGGILGLFPPPDEGRRVGVGGFLSLGEWQA